MSENAWNFREYLPGRVLNCLKSSGIDEHVWTYVRDTYNFESNMKVFDKYGNDCLVGLFQTCMESPSSACIYLEFFVSIAKRSYGFRYG